MEMDTFIGRPRVASLVGHTGGQASKRAARLETARSPPDLSYYYLHHFRCSVNDLPLIKGRERQESHCPSISRSLASSQLAA